MLQIRGQQVLLDRDVAALYGVETKTEELEILRSRFSSANLSDRLPMLTERSFYAIIQSVKYNSDCEGRLK